ncbi:hypothetical protein RHSP_59614 [Rhizobium freirei PRF 81]|uniref:Uncharacterized protein n=1 Tax=Rhizobium freirei PRF 81 TaxID=363754 RepID=N6UHA7_9HYPH|nr:hypothetical protein [Rhizobium freirei]ENN89608.1 hypothetical protein RHSP_59614 [Rhizobium freirei PRF 81]
MSNSQKRAIQNYRSRLGERGLARFEVLGLDADRTLIREMARRLAEGGTEAARLRDVLTKTVSGDPPKKGGVYAWLRSSPLVGTDIDLERVKGKVREIDL